MNDEVNEVNDQDYNMSSKCLYVARWLTVGSASDPIASATIIHGKHLYMIYAIALRSQESLSRSRIVYNLCI